MPAALSCSKKQQLRAEPAGRQQQRGRQGGSLLGAAAVVHAMLPRLLLLRRLLAVAHVQHDGRPLKLQQLCQLSLAEQRAEVISRHQLHQLWVRRQQAQG